MRTVSITEIRQDATRLIEEAARTHTPLLVIQRSRATAYVVPAADYEALEQELRELRHRVFWQDVDEALAEHQRGEGTVYTDAEALIRDLGLEASAPKRAARRSRPPAATGAPSASTRASGKPAARSRRRNLAV